MGRMEGKTQQPATVMAGMSGRSERKWQCGPSDRATTLQENRFRHPNYNETTVPFPTWEYRPGVQVSTITWHCLSRASAKHAIGAEQNCTTWALLVSINVHTNCSGEVSQRLAGSRLGV